MSGLEAHQVRARLRLIGGFELTGADGAAVTVSSRRGRGLLAYLYLATDHVAVRERLSGLLWSDRGEAQARSSLRQVLLELRDTLAGAGLDILQVGRDRVTLRAEAVASDVGELERALAGDDADGLAVELGRIRANRLLQDHEIAGLFQDWLDQTRSGLDRAIAASVQSQLDRLQAAGHWPQVRAIAEAYLQRDPIDEVVVAAAIRADCAMGATALAHRRYQSLRATLAREFGASPGAAVEEALAGAKTPPRATAGPEKADSPWTEAAPTDPLLAVLAFDNLSGDPDMGYFSDGLSEEILETVARGAALKVIGRGSSFQFRGAHKAAANVAAELRATHVLDGSVRRHGNRLRIAAHLIACADEVTLWSHRFDGDLTDVFALQERIAEAVARGLKIRLAVPTQSAVIPPAVYELFLQARGLLAEGSPLFDDSPAEAAPLLERVVRQAPEYAAAWELLAVARAWVLKSSSKEQRGGYAEGRAGVLQAARTALNLDPKRGGAYVALAMLEPWGAYVTRERLLGQALEVAPHDPVALTELSTFCWTVGRFRDALRLAEQACELNPLMPSARLQVAEMRGYVGDYEAAVRMMQELHRLWPRNAGILLSLLNFSSSLDFWDAYDEAVAAIEAFDGWQANDLRATDTYAKSRRSNDPALRARRLSRYTELLEKTGTLPLNLIDALSFLGMPDEALTLAERASYAHLFDPQGPLPSYYPGSFLGRWSELNRMPRFIDLCDRLGLCAYWAASECWPDCVAWAEFDFKAEARRRIAAPNAP